MRHGRAKQARRTLHFFERTVGVRPPYHVVLDGTFVVAVIKYKVPVQDRLDKLLQHGSTFTLYVCASTVAELTTLLEQCTNAPGQADVFRQAIQWCSQHCTRIEPADYPAESSSRTGKKCILSSAAADILKLVLVAANKNNSGDSTISHAESSTNHHQQTRQYFCASQDEELLDACRHAATIPLIRLARGSVLLLEQPSKFSSQADTRNEKTKWKSGVVSTGEQQLVELVVKQQKQERKNEHTATVAQQERMRKPKKAKGPNPLSCKKRSTEQTTASTNRRKRPRKATSKTGDARQEEG